MEKNVLRGRWCRFVNKRRLKKDTRTLISYCLVENTWFVLFLQNGHLTHTWLK